MDTTVTSSKHPDLLIAELPQALAAQQYAVLHVFDMQGILHMRQATCAETSWVLEVVHAAQAQALMALNPGLGRALPWRVSVWTDQGQCHLGLASPQAAVLACGGSEEALAIAAQAEAELTRLLKQCS
jgi:uncharacterized protein (DUF302 family)